MLALQETGMGQWATLIRALSPKELDQLVSAIRKSNDAITESYKTVNSIEKQIEEYNIVKNQAVSEFGFPTPFNLGALIAMIPVLQAKANLNAAIRRIVVMDVTFLELGGVYEAAAIDLKSAGLMDEYSLVLQTSRSINNWRVMIRQKIYSKIPGQGIKERRKVQEIFGDNLIKRGLRSGETEKPGYFDALALTISSVTGTKVPVVTATGLSDAGMGVIGTAIVGLIKVALIVGGVVTGLAIISSIIGKMYAASNAAIESSKEYQKRKTLRIQQENREKSTVDQMVRDGTISFEEAERRKVEISARTKSENREDAKKTETEVRQAVNDAQKLRPSLGGLIWPLAIVGGVVVGGVLLLK